MILVTGGTGNIGSRLALALRKRGESVRVLGLPDPRAESLIRAGVEVIHGNITAVPDVEKACMDVQTVYHLAALLSSPENPARFRTINAGGTHCMLQGAEQARVAHFIYISSISVLYPRLNDYSKSKLAAEDRVRTSPVPWTIARPCLVLDGMGGGEEFRSFSETFRKFPFLRLPNSGKALKRPVHVEDLVEALISIKGNPITHWKTYALGGLETITLGQMAEQMAGRKSGGWIPLPPPVLGVAAALCDRLSLITGRRVSRLTRQGLDGLIFDAAPDIGEAQRDLSWSPRPLGKFHA